jgi:hypothetical protein
MTTNNKDNATEKKNRVKVSKLQVNKETIQELTDKEAERIRDGNIQNTPQGPLQSRTCGGQTTSDCI